MIIQEKPKRAGYFFLKKGTPSPFPEEILGPCGNRPPLFRKTGKKDLPMPSSKTQPAWSQSRPKTRGLHRPQRGKHLQKNSPGTAGSAPGKPVFPFSPPFLQLGRSPQKPPCPPLQNENLPGFCNVGGHGRINQQLNESNQPGSGMLLG